MYFCVREAERLIKPYDKVAIYGAGNYARLAYSLFCRLGYKDKIVNFIVSEASQDDVLEDKQIIPVDEFECQEDNCLIFVAVSEAYEGEIRNVLDNRNFPHTAYMSNYIRPDEDGYKDRLFKGISFEAYCELITDWYIYEHLEQIGNFEKLVAQIYEAGMRNMKLAGDKNLITMIVGIITIRTAKIARALAKKGYEIEVLQLHPGDPYAGESELSFDKIHLKKCHCVEEVLYEALQRKPLVFYIESPWMRASVAEIMLRHKEKFGKIVFTAYDICHGTYIGMPELVYSSERYALENADGIVWRYYSQDFIQKLFGICYSGKMIHFADFCGDYDVEPAEKNDSVVRICSIPTHVSSGLNNLAVSGYMHESTLDEILQKIGNREDCCYHVFYWNVAEPQKKQLQELEAKYNNFKAFYHVEHSKLIKVLSQYDYGCSLWTGDRMPAWPAPMTEEPIAYTEGSIRYGMSNKHFDLLSAGLPIITTAPQIQADELAQRGVLIKMDLESFDLQYLKEHREALKEKVRNIREEFLIDNQIQRLIDFFNELT